MGCSFSGLNAFYDAVNGGGDVWINENRFRIVRQLGEGGFAYVYLVKQIQTDASAANDEGFVKKFKDPSHVSGQFMNFNGWVLFPLFLLPLFCSVIQFVVLDSG